MAPFGRAELYWPGLMLMTVLAIYRPALRGGIRSSKISATGDFSAIVAYEATRREKANVLVFLRDDVEMGNVRRVFFSTKIFQTITSVLTQTNINFGGERHFKQNSSSTITKKISTITKIFNNNQQEHLRVKKSGFAKVWLSKTQQNTALFHFKLSLFYIHQISPLHGSLSRSPP